jgi:hypothetical protein
MKTVKFHLVVSQRKTLSTPGTADYYRLRNKIPAQLHRKREYWAFYFYTSYNETGAFA